MNQLFQRFATVIIWRVAFILMSLDFLADGGILFFPEWLPPVLDAIVKMHLSHVAGIDGARAAAGQRNQEQGQ